MAPGAVMVAGRVGRKENGIISIAGPITNIVLFFIGMIGGGLLLSVLFHPILAEIIVLWMWGNAILGAFNMLPFGPLDGAKVKKWSEPIFWLFLLITLGLVFTLFNGLAIETMESIAGI
jgi:Zn-dependent protease